MTQQDTSKLAYKEVLKTLGDRQKAVYVELSKESNLTNSELAGRLNWTINTVTPRVFELRKANLVQEDCKRPCRVTGRTAIAWRTTRETLF